MHKQVYILILGIIFLVAITHATRSRNSYRDDSSYQERAKARGTSGNNQFINKYMKAMSRRTFYRVSQPLQRRDGGDFTPEQRQYQQQMLDSTNKYRARHCVPPLVPDDDLNRSAQNYAQTLADADKFEHSHTPGLGENLWMSMSSAPIDTVSGADASDAWYSEIKDYDFNNGGFSMGTGHFTQLVWKSSQKLGAGVAFNSDRTKVYGVGQYTPPGNFEGQYADNVLPATC